MPKILSILLHPLIKYCIRGKYCIRAKSLIITLQHDMMMMMMMMMMMAVAMSVMVLMMMTMMMMVVVIRFHHCVDIAVFRRFVMYSGNIQALPVSKHSSRCIGGKSLMNYNDDADGDDKV